VTDVEFCGIDGTRLEERPSDPLLGQVVDRYRVETLIGRGAMGSVYRVRHEVLDRDFALKVLLGDFATDRTLVARFRREAQALSRVRHPNVVSVIDFGNTEAGLTYLVMDYIAGPSLAAVLEGGLALEPTRAASLARQIALGLAETHALGLVHRDVKPGNILLTEEGGVEILRLVDFGIVAIDGSQEATKLTGVGKAVGTPEYMAPEQARGVEATSAVDLYALGVILYQMLAGEVPFPGTGIADILVRHATQPPTPLRTETGLETLVYRLLAKEPEDRPSSALEVIEELDRWLGIEGGPLQRGAPASRRLDSGPRPQAIERSPESALGTMSGALEIEEALGRTWWGWRRTRLLFVLAVILASAFVYKMVIDRPLAIETSVEEVESADVAVQDTPPEVSPTPVTRASTAASSQLEVDEVAEAENEVADEKPSAAAQALPRLQRRLRKVIEGRGMTEDDLDYFASTLTLMRRFERAREEEREADAALYAAELLDAVHTLPLSRRFLRWKIDRSAARIRRSKLDPAAKKALEQRRAELRKRIPSRPDQKAAEASALEITRFERELDRRLR
jgi:serine/threonine protein kinase